MSNPVFSGNFTPGVVPSQSGTTEFLVPLDNKDSSQQVVGEGNRLFMPGNIRKYIPTLYKQTWLNTRAILSVNGYEILDGVAVDGLTQDGVTSDIRNSVLRGQLNAKTVELKDEEIGMTKLVISESPNTDNTARTLTCTDGAKFMVHNGELYDTYTFIEIGGHIEYVQARNASNEVVYIVLQYEGFFSNAGSASGQSVPGVISPSQ